MKPQDDVKPDEGQSASTGGLEREFDAWWESEGQFCRAGGGQYERTFAFRAWEAAREACALACDEIAEHYGQDGGGVADHCAITIRAL